MLIISGQVKRETSMGWHEIHALRQLGDQEADIISIVKGITKYSVMIKDPVSIKYHLERAFHLAKTGRPGPCWIDIPVDVQSSNVDPEDLDGYDPCEDASVSTNDLPGQVSEVLQRLRASKRPVIMIGSGIRLAGAV